MAGKCNCCPPAEEPEAVPIRENRTTTLAPADQLWSTSKDMAVRLRMESSGPASETPITIHQMFLETVESYGDQRALASKEDGQWVYLTWRQYYDECRAAAKSFLKVCQRIDLFRTLMCLHCTRSRITGANRKYSDSGMFYVVTTLQFGSLAFNETLTRS